MPECHRIWALAMFALLAFSSPLLAVDGVIEINQARALAGSVTANDTPGFPVTISESGSYRLTGNLVVPDANTDGISITASSVTVDLNGFEIAGCGSSSCSSTGSGNGIKATGSGATVTNGTIRGMGSAGLLLSTRSLVDRVSAYSNGTDGISVGARSTVMRSIAEQNRRDGIRALSGCVVTGNVASENLSRGLVATGASTISGNTTIGNNTNGIECVASSVIGNTANTNGSFGLNNATGASCGYANNVLNGNNGGSNADPQVGGSAIQMGTNVCGSDTTCP